MSIELAKAVLKNPNLIYDKKELEKYGFKDVVKAVTSLNFTFRDNKSGMKFLKSFRLEGTNPTIEKGTFPINRKNKTAYSFQIK